MVDRVREEKMLWNTLSRSVLSSMSSLSVSGSSTFPTMFFLFFLTGSLWELSILPQGGLWSPPPFEEFWVAFLLGWVVGAMLWDVVLLGVLVGDWTLFSPRPFPCCLYNSMGLYNVSMSPFWGVGVFSSLSLSSFRRVWIKELLKPTTNKCSRKIPLGSNPLFLSAYLRFKLLKWLVNSSILLTFLNTKSPTFQGRGMNCFFLF